MRYKYIIYLSTIYNHKLLKGRLVSQVKKIDKIERAELCPKMHLLLLLCLAWNHWISDTNSTKRTVRFR